MWQASIPSFFTLSFEKKKGTGTVRDPAKLRAVLSVFFFCYCILYRGIKYLTLNCSTV